MSEQKLILASSSPRRLELLAQIGITPFKVYSPDVDESEGKNELPRQIATRLAMEKAQKVAPLFPGCFILAGDSVVACGRRSLPKAETKEQAAECMRLLSGRRHRIYGGVSVIAPDGTQRTKLIETIVHFKKLTPEEQAAYVAAGEWQGKAGGYAVQGLAACFVKQIQGSFSNIMGLPLFDTFHLLKGLGFRHAHFA